MSRIISRAAQGSCLILLAACFDLPSAEKTTKESPALADARREVTAALKAEAAGDNAERREHLATAAAKAPELAEANWHLTKVRVGDRWLSLAEAERRAADDPQLGEYRKLRDEAEGNAKLIRSLARWCTKAGWEDTAKLHYAQLLHRGNLDDETFREAIKRLDLHYVGGKWISSQELKTQDERARAIDAALRQWRPRLKKLQLAIDGDDYSLRERAIKELLAIDDPHVIGPVASFQLDGGDRFCEYGARLLAKFPQFEATEALVQLTVLSPFAAAREAAIAGLKDRPKHDYMPQLIAGLISPINFQYAFSVDSRGVQYKHAWSREDATTRISDVRDGTITPALWKPKAQYFVPAPGYTNRIDLLVAAVSKTRDAAMALELEANSINQQADMSNRRVFDALEQLADAQVPRDANKWQQWWQDYNQYYWPKQTYSVYQRGMIPYMVGYGMSCFRAGTLVRTERGLSAIEWLKPGDRVLAQDQDTGELAYKVLFRTTIRPPASMVRIQAGGDEITTTLGHPFWVNGHGWKMAKELAAGDYLHSVDGAVRIENVTPAGEDKAYNLVVDDFNTYFVGSSGLLVHDNEFRKPTRAIVPGLIDDAAEAAKK